MAESKKKQERILVSQNKKAFHDFFILDRYEAGIALIGCEVKSIREHKVNLKDSFARIKNGEVLVFNMHISPYINSRTEEINPTRVRKLLLHRREIDRIISKLKDKSITLVPVSVYIDRGLVKIELATAKGKLKSDKRQDLEKKESELEIKRALKNRNKQYRSR
jgi:SsrA-binding protein